MLTKVIEKLKRKLIIIDIGNQSIEIDGIEVWEKVGRFIHVMDQKQWLNNGKALG